jgi:hypothetical protein
MQPSLLRPRLAISRRTVYSPAANTGSSPDACVFRGCRARISPHAGLREVGLPRSTSAYPRSTLRGNGHSHTSVEDAGGTRRHGTSRGLTTASREAPRADSPFLCSDRCPVRNSQHAGPTFHVMSG